MSKACNPAEDLACFPKPLRSYILLTEIERGGAWEMLDPTRPHWVPAVVAPIRDWHGRPGCRRGARFLISELELRPAYSDFPAFDSRADCLRWIMAHRMELVRNAPEAPVVPVDLARWMLGLD